MLIIDMDMLSVKPPHRSRLLATIVYHDLFDIPLTAWDVFQYQIADHKALNTEYAETMKAGHCEEERRSNPFGSHSKVHVEEIATSQRSTASTRDDIEGDVSEYSVITEALSELCQQGVVSEKNGYYFLKGRNAIYETHIERLKIAEEKWHRVRRIVAWYAAVPFVRAVCVSGSVAMGNATPSSDIDLLVIAQHGRIWMTRFILVLLTFFAGKLRSSRLGTGAASKCCLNHFITTESLALQVRGLYTAAIYTRLIPVIGPEWLDRLYAANAWLGELFPAFLQAMEDGEHGVASVHRKTIFPHRVWRRARQVSEWALGGYFGALMEFLLKKIQHMLIMRNVLTAAALGRVVANNEELAFHPESPEKKIIDIYAKKMLKYTDEKNSLFHT